ncbi:phosphatidylinositol glycan anchor biosynthesis class U protein isoform X1 [Schistocerca gregaria]|uniref:phosphatidylinositol glycan anchor biosynthesis class U protein isoform X1 n=1 Tax=Schistocerca gregaria TaxID=7010 RepID=UPI00211E1254|nr:phosphatidylinositol glycan anchor biosynthesis class U protein isoform X1 [Schistocerca gregaria]
MDILKISTLVVYAVAGAIRFWFLNSDYRQIIADRVEISTPLNSWKKVTEGVFLYNEGTDPYSGDVFHDTPVGLLIYSWVFSFASSWLNIIFVACDLLTAYFLNKAAHVFMLELELKQNEKKDTYAAGTKNLLLKAYDFHMVPFYVLSAYLFNPYIILNCVGRTTTVFSNLLLAYALASMCTGKRVASCCSVALLTLQSLYPAILVMPAALYIYKNEAKTTVQNKRYTWKQSFIYTFVVFSLAVGSLLFLSYKITGSLLFLNSVYGFILTVPDLKPNIGLFWYFFTEMFEHFRPLFIAAFQINATVLYMLPLTLRLREEPMLLATSFCALISVFKSYPCLGDVGFYLALLPMWKHLYNHMQQGFIVACFFITTSVLGPVLWHLWIYSRSANANFYFGVTLAFGTAQIFLITDILFAYIKREFYLNNGLPRDPDGKPSKIVLQ